MVLQDMAYKNQMGCNFFGEFESNYNGFFTRWYTQVHITLIEEKK